jgi:hypothetical protein
MKRTLSFVGCGLLVVALGAVGCSSKMTNGNDAGTDSGTSKAGTGATAGKSGSGAAGKSGAGGAAGGSAMSCMDTAKANSSGIPPAACITCLCSKDATKTAACGKPCWDLSNCVGQKCKGNAMDLACIQAMCATELGGKDAIAQSQATPFGMCATECGATSMPVGTDAGKADAGN